MRPSDGAGRVRPVTGIRLFLASAAAFVMSLALAAPALADKGGEGLYGKYDDKVVTNFGFGLMIFFTVLISALSLAQHLLQKRKK